MKDVSLEGGTEHRDRFVAELGRWREVRGLSRAALARLMGYHRSYVSKVAGGSEPASREFAMAADEVLNSGGALWRAWTEQHAKNTRMPTRAATSIHPAAPDGPGDPGGALVVEHDHATLSYEDGVYRATMRRLLHNGGTQPITRYLIRISVDRYPGDPQRSNALYRNDPLTWDEIGLQAWHGQDRAVPMRWTVQQDRDAFKEVWLQFSAADQHFPLYPGESTWIEYTYTVSDTKWGHWFQRAVRLPTQRLSVTLEFPASVGPSVWGLHTSMSAESMPFQNSIRERAEGDGITYSWSTEDPPLHGRYRLEWAFGKPVRQPQQAAVITASQTMSQLGVVQDGNPILRRTARSFDLPAEAEDACRVVTELAAAARRISAAHTFGKGIGVSAPQIGIDRAAAVVVPPGSDSAVTLLNPEVVETSTEKDEQYEGCLSFFDVRCLVGRALAIHVRHTDIDGTDRITVFERGMARLVAHEIDHLNGVLCKDHLRPGIKPIPVEHYRETGRNWKY